MNKGNMTIRSIVSASVLLAGLMGMAQAQSDAMSGDDALSKASVKAQHDQAQLQNKIDAADDATRKALAELRSSEREARRLESYNAELSRQVAEQGHRIERRQRSIEQLANAGERLPVLTRQLVSRLERLIGSDMPFLHDERQARVASLNRMLDSGELSAADKLDRVLAAWRTELDYGSEVDAWHGTLQESGNSDGTQREVDYLRLGRLGWYYLTPDGKTGGVWHVDDHQWHALDDAALREVRKGIRIAHEERVPDMLDLPLSVAPGGQAPEGQS